MIVGYIIKNSQCAHLTKHLYWYTHQSDDAAYVFTDRQLRDIRKLADSWDTKPATLISATYDGGTVQLTGSSRAF
jgi:hypothetical protein